MAHDHSVRQNALTYEYSIRPPFHASNALHVQAVRSSFPTLLMLIHFVINENHVDIEAVMSPSYL
jgi:hypothetical protein